MSSSKLNKDKDRNMFLDDIVGPLSIEEARQSRRMSAQVKLSRALDREREKSRAERERTQRYLDAIMPDKKPEEPKDKEVAEVKQRLDAKCWTGKHKEGTKIKGGVRVNNCVPNESATNEAANAAQQDAIAIAKKKKKAS